MSHVLRVQELAVRGGEGWLHGRGIGRVAACSERFRDARRQRDRADAVAALRRPVVAAVHLLADMDLRLAAELDSLPGKTDCLRYPQPGEDEELEEGSPALVDGVEHPV